jgi:hypothetical protein
LFVSAAARYRGPNRQVNVTAQDPTTTPVARAHARFLSSAVRTRREPERARESLMPAHRARISLARVGRLASYLAAPPPPPPHQPARGCSAPDAVAARGLAGMRACGATGRAGEPNAVRVGGTRTTRETMGEDRLQP